MSRSPHTAAFFNTRLDIALGLLLAAHFLAVCMVKVVLDRPDDIWWMSHIALAVGSASLLLRSTLLASAAMTLVFLPHALWLLDWLVMVFFGWNPLGITAYLREADALVWIGTVHHFYLLPTLLIMCAKRRVYDRSAVVLAVVLFAIGSGMGRLAPSELNVNYAHRVSKQWGNLEVLNDLPAGVYLLCLNVLMIIVMLVPAWITLNVVFANCSVLRQSHREHSATQRKSENRNQKAESGNRFI